MKFYLMNKRWPVYYKIGDNYFPLGDLEPKQRTNLTHSVVAELNHHEALQYIWDNPSLMYDPIQARIASDTVWKLVKDEFYKEVLDND